ncbi:hypothetical protein UNDYM_0872 [Undibacterium sp. YM2]|nr:hypothetical protein UNDYM_0872 [Undibacterium sp. YM2]
MPDVAYTEVLSAEDSKGIGDEHAVKEASTTRPATRLILFRINPENNSCIDNLLIEQQALKPDIIKQIAIF